MSSFVHHFKAIDGVTTGVTVRKHQIWVKIGDFSTLWRQNLTDDIEKKIGHLFYATSSFVFHFIAICEFKMELQSGNAKFWSKSVTFCAMWPGNMTDDLEKQKGTSSMLLQALCIIS